MKALVYCGLFNDYQFVLDGARVVDYALSERDVQVRLGDVYLAKLVEVQAAFCFVEIDGGARLFIRKRDVASTLNQISPKLNDDIYVQVDAAPIAQKWGRATGRLELASPNMVLVTDRSGLQISRKIGDKALREKLVASLEPLVDSRFGIVLRTSARDVPAEALGAELARLKLQFEGLLVRPSQRQFVRLRHRLSDDLFSKYRGRLKGFIGYDRKAVAGLNFTKMTTLRQYFDLMAWLKDSACVEIETAWGVQLVVQQLEAMTVVDLNAKSLKVDLAAHSFNYAVNYYGVQALIGVVAARKISGTLIVDCLTLDKSQRKRFLSAISPLLKDAAIHLKGMTESGLLELSIARGAASLMDSFYARSDMGYVLKSQIALDYWLDVAAYRAQTTGQSAFYLAVSRDVYYVLKRSQKALSEYLQRHQLSLHCAVYEGLSGYIAPLKRGLADDCQKIEFEVFK